MNKNELKYGLAFHLANNGNMYYCGKEGKTYLFLNDTMLLNEMEEYSQVLIKFNLPFSKLEQISNQRRMHESQGKIEYYLEKDTKFINLKNKITKDSEQFKEYLNKLNKVPLRIIAA